jgi:NAD(P)-dependent dehydrogenase (short-subunit alcohol dehydrogenase family)
MGRFDNEVVLVTGGARGIGRACVERFAGEGAAVAFCDIDTEVGEQTAVEIGGNTRFYTCDIAQESQIEAFAAGCAADLGAATVVVNNAGVNANFDLTQLTTDEWERFFAVDLRSAWLTVKHTAPAMKTAGRGAIVNVSSFHGFASLEGFFPYGAAKAGLVGLTRNMALDLGPFGVRANVVCPGFIRTRLSQDSMNRSPDPAASKAQMERAVALRRIAEPSEVASVIAFLASDDASYVTGASLLVDGGVTARRAG